MLQLALLMQVCQEERRVWEDKVVMGKAAFARFLLRQICPAFEMRVRSE